MTWRVSNVLDQRIRFVVQALQPEANVSRLCLEFGISRPTGYRWLHRYSDTNCLEALTDLSRRPHLSPNRTEPGMESQVVELRTRYGWGAKKLQILLLQQGMRLGVRTINRILARCDLLKSHDCHRPATKRFERAQPNELWQMDFKGEYGLPDGRCYPLVILDDHSRFALATSALASQQTVPVQETLIRTFEQYGVPEAMLMDHGVPWWSTSNGYGLSTISVALIKQGIQLLFGAIRHPQTQGKIERFNRTLKQAAKHHGPLCSWGEWDCFLADFRHDYNHVRPHEALNMARPADVYRPSPRPYDPTPKPWEYPTEALVHRLNSEGFVTYHGRRYFVSESLADEPVMVQPFADRLLVTFRHMHVREVDLLTGRSYPIVRPTAAA